MCNSPIHPPETTAKIDDVPHKQKRQIQIFKYSDTQRLYPINKS